MKGSFDAGMVLLHKHQDQQHQCSNNEASQGTQQAQFFQVIAQVCLYKILPFSVIDRSQFLSHHLSHINLAFQGTREFSDDAN